jgi:hypothetical protein
MVAAEIGTMTEGQAKVGAGVLLFRVGRLSRLYAAARPPLRHRRDRQQHGGPRGRQRHFPWVAFHSFEFLLGQIVGKAWMVLASLPFIYWLRARDACVAQKIHEA